MVITKTEHTCEKCGRKYDDKIKAASCESQPITGPDIESGSIFQNLSREGFAYYYLVIRESMHYSRGKKFKRLDENHNKLYDAEFFGLKIVEDKFLRHWRVRLGGQQLEDLDKLSGDKYGDIKERILENMACYDFPGSNEVLSVLGASTSVA